MVFSPPSNGVPAKVATMPSIKKRRSTGAGASASPRSNQRLSQASLQKAFFSMLASVGMLYFLLIFLFFRRHDLRVYRDRGGFNHSIRSNTAEAWKTHIQRLAREEEERQRIREQIIPVQSHKSDRKDLEETDIEEMVRPEEIRGKKDGTDATQKANSSMIQVQPAMTAFASSNLDNLLNAGALTEIHFPKVSSCSSFLEMEQKSLEDPFLPKLRNVFASSDGSYIEIAAQNSIQCRNETDASIMKKMHLQAALFQPVSVKRIEMDGETKYQVASSDKDDSKDVVATRFLCRFEPTGLETLSTFSQQDGASNISASDANLFFQCPVPNDLIPSLKQKMQDQSEQPDFTLTLVPFRTQPRVQGPEDAMPPCYLKPESEESNKLRRKLKSEPDFLPKITEAARWEHVPICISNSKAT